MCLVIHVKQVLPRSSLRIFRFFPWWNTVRQTLNDAGEVWLEEKRCRITFKTVLIDYPVEGRAIESVGPTLQHVSQVNDESSCLRGHIYPDLIFKLYLEARYAVSVKQSEHSVVRVLTTCVNATLPS